MNCQSSWRDIRNNKHVRSLRPITAPHPLRSRSGTILESGAGWMSHHLESRPRKDVAGIPHQRHADHGRGAKMGITPLLGGQRRCQTDQRASRNGSHQTLFPQGMEIGRCLIPADRWYEWSAAPVRVMYLADELQQSTSCCPAYAQVRRNDIRQSPAAVPVRQRLSGNRCRRRSPGYPGKSAWRYRFFRG